MMKIFRVLFLLILPIHFYLTSYAQIGHSPLVDSLIGEIHYDSLMLMDRQLSGDTSVVINGVLETITSRHSDHPGNVLAEQYILHKFLSYGLDTRTMDYDANGRNIIATVTGSVHPEQQYIICAHYDSRPDSSLAPGGDDNASGVCAVLQSARLASGQTFPYTLKFIAFDEEEQGLIGSTAYVDSAFANGDNILGVLNLDMIAWNGDADLNVTVSSNDPSMHLLCDNMACMRLYRPELHPDYINFGGSDHYRFWGKGFKAIQMCEDKMDYNPNYHTVNDSYNNIDKDYFYKMTQAAAATFLSWGWNCRMSLGHDPLSSTSNTAPRIAMLTTDPDHPAAAGENAPRLYYSVDNGPYTHIHAFYSGQDTLKFLIPGFSYGTKVSYYFAVQDTSAFYANTLPDAGKGVNPPGLVPPPEVFSYVILNNDAFEFSALGLPAAIPAEDTVIAAITIDDPGRIIDLNVGLSIQHTNAWDLNIFLISPDGTQVKLSTENGFMFDHYISTVFDDEAPSYIYENKPPFTGPFKPEQCLSILNDKSLQGTWTLKVVNRGWTAGQLTAFSLQLTYGNSDLYVDGARPTSGDGLSWSTALNSISEAAQLEPGPGNTVFVKPGTYHENIAITSNGEQTVPLTTGIQLDPPNIIHFPPGSDLSAVDISSYPGEYYAYIYRSRSRNAGYFQIEAVDYDSAILYVVDSIFFSEEGVTGDTNSLSCAIGRPVTYRKYSSDPVNERVIVDATGDTSLSNLLYIGDPIGDGATDAFPANFNIIDGIDLTGLAAGEAIRLQSSSFNVIRNSHVYENNGTGIVVDGNESHPACHNFIENNRIYNNPDGGIIIGLADMPAFNNCSNFNHLQANYLFASGTGANAHMHRGIVIGHYNKGSIVRDNRCMEIDLEEESSSILEIHEHANGTLIFGNYFRKINSLTQGYNSMVRVFGNCLKVDIYNNILADTIPYNNNIYAFRIAGNGTDSCRVVHNTIYNMDRGFLLEDSLSPPVFQIMNNIIYVNEECFTHYGMEGRFQVSHNLYSTDPTPDSSMAYFHEDGRQIGLVKFANAEAGDFHLVFQDDPALCAGTRLFPAISLDPDRNLRCTEDPDVGAFELINKFVWEGDVDSNWNNSQNWSTGLVPNRHSNIIVEVNNHLPVINSGISECNGIYLKDGASVTVIGPGELRIMGIN